MSSEGAALREIGRRIGEAKGQSRAADLAALLALPIGARIEACAALSDQLLGAFPPDDFAADDEAAVIARVQRRLARAR